MLNNSMKFEVHSKVKNQLSYAKDFSEVKK